MAMATVINNAITVMKLLGGTPSVLSKLDPLPLYLAKEASSLNRIRMSSNKTLE